MDTYRFSWNGRNRFIDAGSLEEAKTLFQEKYGFWPEELTTITKLEFS